MAFLIFIHFALANTKTILLVKKEIPAGLKGLKKILFEIFCLFGIYENVCLSN